MPANRMNRDQFFAVTSELDADGLRKVLWSLYWRGTADARARIEAELAGGGRTRASVPAKVLPDPETVRVEVDEFVALARAGAYLGRDRRVSPKERTRWRFTFKRLADQAQEVLRAEDPARGAAALQQLIDLACETRDYDYFRSEDPVAAAGFVVSDAVTVLWESAWHHGGFAGFAETAATQLIRWESEFGWTRVGMSAVAAKETTLAVVLTRLLKVADTWEGFAEQYVAALDRLADRTSAGGSRRGATARADALAQWHDLLLERLFDGRGELLDRIAGHAALGGPARSFFAAKLAHRRDDLATARKLTAACLRELPGHSGFRDFAAEIELA